VLLKEITGPHGALFDVAARCNPEMQAVLKLCFKSVPETWLEWHENMKIIEQEQEEEKAREQQKISGVRDPEAGEANAQNPPTSLLSQLSSHSQSQKNGITQPAQPPPVQPKSLTRVVAVRCLQLKECKTALEGLRRKVLQMKEDIEWVPAPVWTIEDEDNRLKYVIIVITFRYSC
jgi:hypothetical protein